MIQKKTLIPSICIPAALACLPAGVGPQKTTQMCFCTPFWHPSPLYWQCELCELFDCVFMGRFQKTHLNFFWHFQQSSIHPTLWVGYFVLLGTTFSPPRAFCWDSISAQSCKIPGSTNSCRTSRPLIVLSNKVCLESGIILMKTEV